MTDSLTHHVAGFIAGLRFEHISAEVIEVGRANSMRWSEVSAKFEETTAHGGLPADRARTVVRMVEDLPDLPDVRRLAEALALES